MPTPTTYNTQYELYNVDFKRGDVRHFTSEAQRSEYFDNEHLIDSGTVTSYIRNDESFVADKTYADVREANYCRYNNGDGDGWRYAYITRMEVVSTSCTRLYIQQDPWQNNMFNFKMHGTRLRGHVDRLHKSDNICYRTASYTPEPLETDLFVTDLSTTANPVPLLWVALTTYLGTEPTPINNLNSDFVYYFFPVGIPESSFTVTINTGSASQSVRMNAADMYAALKSPYIANAFYSSAAPPGLAWKYNSAENEFIVTVTGSLAAVAAVTYEVKPQGTNHAILYGLQSNYSDLMSFLPLKNVNRVSGELSPSNIRNIKFESKLFGAPYYIILYGVQGNTSEFDFRRQSDSPAVRLEYINLPTGAGMRTAILPPDTYNNNAREVYFNLNYGSIPGTIRLDAENNYMASNGNRFQAQIYNSVLGAFTGRVSGGKVRVKTSLNSLKGPISTLIDMAATRADLESTPDTVSQVGDMLQAYVANNDSPYLVTLSPAADDLDHLYSFFYTYGYTINEWQNIPNTQIRTRYYFDYYLFGDDVHCDVQDSSTARELMEEDLRKGVTFWHWNETTNGFQHTRENLEMSLITN